MNTKAPGVLAGVLIKAPGVCAPGVEDAPGRSSARYAPLEAHKAPGRSSARLYRRVRQDQSRGKGLAKFTSESARRAALRKAEIYPHSHYVAIGRLGGREIVRKYGLEYVRRIASIGGTNCQSIHYFGSEWYDNFYGGFNLDSASGDCQSINEDAQSIVNDDCKRLI